MKKKLKWLVQLIFGICLTISAIGCLGFLFYWLTFADLEFLKLSGILFLTSVFIVFVGTLIGIMNE